MKTCSCCNQSKELNNFNKNKSTKDGYQYWCNSCRKDRYIKTKDSILEKAKLRYNPETKQLYDKKRRELRGDYLRQYDRERSNTLSRRVSANKSTAIRRAKKNNALVCWDKDLTAFVSKEAFTLAKQRESIFGFKWHVDHVIPLQGKTVCGLHVWNNFQVIPAIINIKKSNHFERNV